MKKKDITPELREFLEANYTKPHADCSVGDNDKRSAHEAAASPTFPSASSPTAPYSQKDVPPLRKSQLSPELREFLTATYRNPDAEEMRNGDGEQPTPADAASLLSPTETGKEYPSGGSSENQTGPEGGVSSQISGGAERFIGPRSPDHARVRNDAQGGKSH